MIGATENPGIGHEITPVTHAITRESIAAYSRYASNGHDTRGTRSDDEAARRAGLPHAVAQERYPIGYMSECALAFFGAGWVQGGRIDVNFIKPVYPGDFITVRGIVSDYRRVAGGTRITLDVWLENQRGERVTAGWASGLVPADKQPTLNTPVALPPVASVRKRTDQPRLY